MKIVLFVCISLLFFACSARDTPNEYLKGASLTWRNGNIIKEYTEGIYSKDDLVEHAASSDKTGGLEILFSDAYSMDNPLYIYIKPFYKKIAVLSEKDYPKGMPLKLRKKCGEDDCRFVSDKIILTDGFLSFADSSYNGYTILPLTPFQDIDKPNFNNCDYIITIRKDIN